MVRDKWDAMAEEWDRYIKEVTESGIPFWMIHERMKILQMEDEELNVKLKQAIDSQKLDHEKNAQDES